MNWDEFHRLDKKRLNINKSIHRLEDEHNLDEDNVMVLFNRLNSSRFYGGSY